MKQDVRGHILTTGADLVHKQGFNNTGIQEILKAAGVPKGSFYFYFENKEDFGLNLIDHFLEQFAGMAGQTLQNESVSPLQRVRDFFSTTHGYFEEHGFTRGCPVGNLAQEMGDLSEAFRSKLSGSIDVMATALGQVLQEAVTAGEVRSDLQPQETAYFIVASWHGALLRMKVTKSREPLDVFERVVFTTILV